MLVLTAPSCKQHSNEGKQIFRYNESSGIATLDPAYARNQAIMWPIHQLFNTLVEADSNLKTIPALAHQWTISDDKKQIQFHLRTDVFFHNDPCFKNGTGRRMIASDVQYSLQRIISSTIASSGAWIFNGRVDSISPFEVINDSTFQLNLKTAFQPILGILSMQYCSIIPREAVEFYGADFRRHPVGTGPFCFVAWEEGQALILKKNKNYFQKDSNGIYLPYLDGIKVSFYESKATEFLEFKQGRLDFINDIDASFKNEVLTKTGKLQPKWASKINLNKHSYLNIEYLGILVDTTNKLVKNSPLRLLKIRQAINYAINKPKMMLYLRNSIGTAAHNGFIPPGLPGYNHNNIGYTYNPTKALTLLKEAGFSSTAQQPAIKLLTIPIYANLASYIANELAQIGIPIQVEVVQKSLLLQQTSKNQALFFRGSWIADYPDAENYLSVFYGKNPSPPNYTRYNNPTFDALYDAAAAETNDSIRYTMYSKMDAMVMADAPVVPLWYDMVLHLVHKNVKGFSPNSINMLELRHVQKQ